MDITYSAAIILIVLIVMANLIFGVSSPASDVVILLYFLYPLISRQLVARSHRRGMRFFKAGDYIHAIDEFEKSYHFFGTVSGQRNGESGITNVGFGSMNGRAEYVFAVNHYRLCRVLFRYRKESNFSAEVLRISSMGKSVSRTSFMAYLKLPILI